MKLLLDTNVLSEMERPAGASVVSANIARNAGVKLFLSVITLGEIRKGIALMPQGRRRDQLANWMDGLRRAFDANIFAVDTAIAEAWGELDAQARRRGRPVQMADGLIAATARVHDLRVATRNVRDMLAAGAPVYDPWTDQTHEPTP